MKRTVGLAVVVATLVLAVSAVAPAAPAKRPAPRYADPTAVATTLVNRYFNLLVKEDIAGLQSFLAPGFQVQRADGSASDKADFLANLPSVESFSLSQLHATESNGTIVVRYLADATGLVNGKNYSPGPAPRLSVFSWNGKRWQIAAHANFNPLKG
jgi:hypothetical protein